MNRLLRPRQGDGWRDVRSVRRLVFLTVYTATSAAVPVVMAVGVLPDAIRTGDVVLGSIAVLASVLNLRNAIRGCVVLADEVRGR